ncbi:MAG TPA: hypothetical protein VF818_00080 [Ktedonobacterales bacterium]
MGHGLVPPLGAITFRCPRCSQQAHVNLLDLYVAYGERPELLREHAMSHCPHCGAHALYYSGKPVWPAVRIAPLPSPKLPARVLREFEEASSVLSVSPRSSVALLRLALSTLCREMCLTGNSVVVAIGMRLLESGVESREIIDLLRIHCPADGTDLSLGTIEPDDDDRDFERSALVLFEVINKIVEALCT